MAMGNGSNNNKNAACRPPKGKTYLTIGQDLFSISDYALSQYNASLHDASDLPLSAFTPAAAMVYTDIQTLRGLDRPADYGSGVEYADGVLDSLFPGEQIGLQIGLWLNGTVGCEQINKGELDANIKKLIKYLKRCRASKVFLRIGYEFDNPSFGYSTDTQAYVNAYRQIAKACKQTCREKVLLVWHSWAASPTNLTSFYPGDDVVDWVGVSLFQQFYPGSKDGSPKDIKRVLNFAAQHNKPTMIAESTPFGGMQMNLNLTDPWQQWFQPTLDLIEEHDISMWSYISSNWDSQPMWRDSGFGDTRLSTDATVMEKWRDLVLEGTSNRSFLVAGSLVDCGKRGNGQYHSVSFGSPRDLVQPHPRQVEIWRGYVFLTGAALFAALAALVVWRRRRINWEETSSFSSSGGLGYGSIEGLPGTIPTHSIRVRVRGGSVTWRDPLAD